MKAQTNGERSFSVELRTKADLRNMTLTNGSSENVLIEGTIGELVQIRFTEGIILEVTGERGVLRVDLKEDEVIRPSPQTRFDAKAIQY